MPRRTRLLGKTMVAGVVVALVIGAAGAFYLIRRPVRYSAKASIVILPAQSLSADAAISAFDALSAGQIVPTFAEILSGENLRNTVTHQLGLSPAQVKDIGVTVSVVAATSLINVTATAPQASEAERLADGIVAEAQLRQAELGVQYRSVIVDSAAGTATRSGTAALTLLATFGVIALIAGLASQQSLYYLLGRRGRPRVDNEPAVPRVAIAWFARPGEIDELFRRPMPTRSPASAPGPPPRSDPY